MHPVELQQKYEEAHRRLLGIEGVDPAQSLLPFRFVDEQECHHLAWLELGDDEGGIELSDLKETAIQDLLKKDEKLFGWTLWYFTQEQFESSPDPYNLDAACCDGCSVDLEYDDTLPEYLITLLEQAIANPEYDSEEKEAARHEAYYEQLRDDTRWREETFFADKEEKYHLIRIFYSEELTNQDTGTKIQNIVQAAKGGGNVSGAEMWGRYWSEYAKYTATSDQHREIIQHIEALPNVASILYIY